jgi:hypothetical protein
VPFSRFDRGLLDPRGRDHYSSHDGFLASPYKNEGPFGPETARTVGVTK